MTRAELLHAFVMAFEGAPVEWGRSDCTSFCVRWFEQTTGQILVLPAYASEGEARRLITMAGGLDALWLGSLLSAGFSASYDAPELGDVGIIRMSWGMSGCIFGLDGTAFIRSDLGTALLRPRPHLIVKAWHI